MRANIDVQECAMQVSQCRLRLRDLPVPGAVCRPGAPDSTGKDANQGEHGGGNSKGGREAQAAARKTERRSVTTHNASANGDRGAGERGVQLGRKQVEGDAPGGRQGDGGRRARISTHPRGSTSPRGLLRLGSCQSWHAFGQRPPRKLGVTGVVP